MASKAQLVKVEAVHPLLKQLSISEVSLERLPAFGFGRPARACGSRD